MCGAPPSQLVSVNETLPEATRCSICNFPFSLSTAKLPKGQKLFPLPALNDDWVKAWKIVWAELGHDGRATHRVMTSISDPLVIIESHERAKRERKEAKK